MSCLIGPASYRRGGSNRLLRGLHKCFQQTPAAALHRGENPVEPHLLERFVINVRIERGENVDVAALKRLRQQADTFVIMWFLKLHGLFVVLCMVNGGGCEQLIPHFGGAP